MSSRSARKFRFIPTSIHCITIYQVPADSIFVIDHESVDGSTDTAALASPCHVIRVANGGVHDHRFLLENVQVQIHFFVRFGAGSLM
jgi:hypothetical protein